ncbi:MAG: sterol desaturase family protein [Myxococcales bacterium]|nr:sterol desaturase family protein [Myxococcales bacterium]
MSSLIYFAIPAFILTLGLEVFFVTRAQREGHRGYELRDSLASLSMGLGNVGISALTKGGWVFLWVWLYEHRLFDLPQDAAWVWVLLFVAEDLCYYVFHRTSHESRFFWAAHVNHHSSQHYNLSTALRQTWTGPLIGGVFWAPLALLGFHPAMILVQQAISLLYQYWIHVEWLGKLGPLEWVFNTPSHHRVHHGRNPLYLDRNHGGILIVWDRLFGTFEEEREAPDYGLTKNLDTFNPFRIAFHEWAAIGRDLRAARSLREALGVVFGPPGWRADGTGETSVVMRARHLEASAGSVDAGALVEPAEGLARVSSRSS